jgi:glycosyltransferase involved in cell wall biosynthesis
MNAVPGGARNVTCAHEPIAGGQDASPVTPPSNDTKATVAACLIAKDEERNIGRCLASLQGKVDEIIVVDTGSADRTAEIAAKAGARVVHFPWCDDFAAARNFSVQQASSDWVVWVDADEELVEETPGALRRLCQNRQVQRGYLVDCRNLSNEQGDVSTIIRQWRLFRNHAGIHFEGRIHEHLIPADGNKQVELAEQKEVWVRHWGYIPKPDVMKRKRDRNFALLERALEEEPDDAFLHYNLGKQYTAERQFEPGLQALERAVELWFEQGQMPYAYTGNMFALAINAAVELGQNEKALDIEGRIPPALRGSDVMFQAGVACMRLKRYDEAIIRLNMAWQRPTGGQSIESDPSLSTWRPLGALANLYMEVGNPTEAYACAQRAYQLAPEQPNVLYALAFISAHVGKLDEALSWARRLLAGQMDAGFKAQARRIMFNIGRGTNQPELLCEAMSGPIEGVSEEEVARVRDQVARAYRSERGQDSEPPGVEGSSPSAQKDERTEAAPPKRRGHARKTPLLSVVIPAYRAAMLRRCLASTRDITVDCEIVVVDDASAEDLKSVVAAHAATDKRVRYVRNEANLGIPRNFNRCIELARGQYVCILGDDDQFLPGNFEQKLAVLESNPDVGFVYSRWNGLDEHGQVVFGGAALHTNQSYAGGRREFHDLLHGNYINLISLVFRRELFERYGGFDESIPTLCDWDMCLRWAYETKTAFVAEPLANVLVHAGSDTQQRGIQDQQFAKDKLAVWRKWLIDRDPPLIIDEETWLRLAQFYNADLAHWFGADAATVEHYRQQFNQLQQAYVQTVRARFARLWDSACRTQKSGAVHVPHATSQRRSTAPKLSILIPAYNRPDMLAQCLDSLRSVTSDCEIVVVDDCSPTDLGPHVEPYIARDGRIRFCRNKTNLGPTGNFNHAIELARGRYFCILGDDETVLPGNFEKKLAILDAHPDIGFAYSRHYYTNEQGDATELAMWPGMLHFSYVGGRDEFHDLFPWNYISLHSVVYRKELFERYGGFDPQITECGNDWEMNIRYAFHTETAYIDEPLLNVRVHQGATTRRLGLLDQKLATGRIQVWRKWLVDKSEPLVLDERAWAHMHGLFVRDVNFWFQGQPALVQKWLAEFQQLKQDAQAAVQRHFFAAVPELAPAGTLAPVSHSGRGEESVPGRPAGAPPAAEDALKQPVPLPASHSPIRVMWEGGFFETHSLALVNREWAGAVLRSGQVELSLQNRQLEPLKFDPRSDPKLAPLVARAGAPLTGAPAVHIRQAWPPVFDKPAAGKWVMVQPWEYGRLPQDWVAPMRDLVDEIWAYSGIVKQMYVESGVPGDKIHIVPAGIDPLRFRPGATPIVLPSKKSVRFLFVGGTIWRKGIDLLLEAYRRTFTRKDDVSLVIKDMGQDSFYQGQGAGETIKRLQADPQAPEIVYATGSLPDDQMASLYTACHCLVHPYRGEGFGLPVAEAMACGLAVIVTQGGSTDDFCDESRALFVPASRRFITIETPTAGQAWVLEPDIDALGRQMRRVYENPQAAAALGRRASEWVRTNLTWEQGAAKAVERIRALAGGEAEPHLFSGATTTNADQQPRSDVILSGAKQLPPQGPERQSLPSSSPEKSTSSREAELLTAVQRLTASSSIAGMLPISQLPTPDPSTQYPAPSTRPKLSIVIPAYNRPDMLTECLASLKAVSVDCEIVVYDDASPTDLTPTVEAAMKDDPRIRFIRSQENAGIPESFNRALAQARGDYLCIMGDDDSVLPGNFEKKVALLDQHPQIGFVYSRWFRTNEANQPTLVESMWHTNFSYSGGRNEFIDLLPGNYINLVTFVFRRTLFEERGGFDPECVTFADWDLFLRYAAGGTQTAFINEPLGNARCHTGTDTSRRGHAQGAFVRDKLCVWRKWLLDSDDPPAIEERTWQAMARFWQLDLQGMFGNDQAAIQQGMQQLQAIYDAYQAKSCGLALAR